MGFLAILCLAQGLYPKMLYQFLPYQEAVGHFVPWTAWNVLQALMLLGFSGLAFYIMRKVIEPHKALNLDFDWFYRLFGCGVLALISRPLAMVDNIWTVVWEKIGLRLLKGLGWFTSWFDRAAIDGVVDGTAYGFKGLGHLAAFAQSGRLQHYLGLMVVLALLIFAFFWYGF
jgi:multicomponent Na+:H+ antiporter subunit D